MGELENKDMKVIVINHAYFILLIHENIMYDTSNKFFRE